MADEEAPLEAEQRRPRRRWRRWVLGIPAGLLGLVALLAFLIDTPIGHRMVASYIAGLEPQSGLRIEIGEITGSLYGKAQLRDVVLSDPQGEFLEIPNTELDWRPLAWLWSGLDIRNLVAHRGEMLRVPDFNPSDPDSPILPDFDIRIDRFELDRMGIAAGIVGDRREIGFVASALVIDGQVNLHAAGRLGEQDRLVLALEAMPDADRFDLELDYNAPKGGLLASLTGAEQDWQARVSGEGSWSRWDGSLEVEQAGEELAAIDLRNRSGTYGADGLVRPNGNLEGLLARAAGKSIKLSIGGTFEASTFDGSFSIGSAALSATGKGAIDFSQNRFEEFVVAADLRDPRLFGPGLVLDGARLRATLNGKFGSMVVDHRLEVGRLAAGGIELTKARQEGVARRIDKGWRIPLNLTAASLATGSSDADQLLANARLVGDLSIDGSSISSDNLRLRSSGSTANLHLEGNLKTQRFKISGNAHTAQLDLRQIGLTDAKADFTFITGGGKPWTLEADLEGVVAQVKNGIVLSIGGPALKFRGRLVTGQGLPILLTNTTVVTERLTLSIDVEVKDGEVVLAGAGQHSQYGHLSFTGSVAGGNVEADLKLDNPFSGIGDVAVKLASTEGGYRINAEGQSLLGPFKGVGRLLLPEGRPVRIAIDRLDVWQTRISGELAIREGTAQGKLTLTGGGLDGTIALSGLDGGAQGFSADIAARGARFGGETPLTIARGTIDIEGRLSGDHSTINGTINAQGIGYGKLFIGRFTANSELNDGRGTLDARMVGQRGSDFELQLAATIAPGQVTLAAKGKHDGKSISMPRRAVLELPAEGGWRLSRSQLSYGDGFVIAEAQATSEGASAGKLDFSRMPLTLLDVAVPGTDLSGTATGKVDWTAQAGHPPVGSARLKIADFSRAGLTLSSDPVNLAIDGTLDERQLRLNAVANAKGRTITRLALSLDNLPTGTLLARLNRGSLSGDMHFSGPASALWPLVGVETFDIVGPVSFDVTAGGRLANPSLTGSLRGENLRLHSVVTGTDVHDLSVRGRMNGSKLSFTRLAGKTNGAGTVSGSGTIDFANVFTAGPKIDIRLAARTARLLDRSDISATLSGPLRIVSDGSGGTIAGRVKLDEGHWQLANASPEEALPVIETVDLNLPTDVTPVRAKRVAWSYLVDVTADDRFKVEGMGLDSEWSANVRLRGTVDDPRLGGEAQVKSGQFRFAGTQFELERGTIRFDESVPPDPLLDILARSEEDGLTVNVTVRGNASQPEIAMRSVPALPEEEILSRLLFGGSINELSGVGALQLGAAVASLRGGGGIGPINRLREAIGLDRLRLLAPDPTIDRGTAIAVGKNFTRRIYVELVTDGGAYNATQLEFRLTSWLTLLATVSSVDRNTVGIEYRKDY